MFACPDCGKGLDVVYDYELAARHFKETGSSERPQNIWHFEELLPIVDASAQARVGRYAGYTPLIHADRLGAELGLSNLYLKDDSTSRPSLSYKDRVVSMSVARLLELGKTEIGCVSTGNVGTAVASLAAKAGVNAYVFYPNRLEDMKARACAALGAKVCQVEGNYDEANRCCREVAAATGMEFANITLRPFYAEGAKTAAFEIVEQLDWAARPTTSSRLPPAAPCRRVCTRALASCSCWGSPRRTHPHPHRPAQRLQPDRQRDHRRGSGGTPSDPGDGRPLASDRRSRRRLSGDRRRPQTRRNRWVRLRPRDLRRDRPARLHRGSADRARWRHDGRGAREACSRRKFAPDEVVVAIITGNGLKTLDDHPHKPWPDKVDCELDAMLAALDALKRDGAPVGSAREQLHA